MNGRIGRLIGALVCAAGLTLLSACGMTAGASTATRQLPSWLGPQTPRAPEPLAGPGPIGTGAPESAPGTAPTVMTVPTVPTVPLESAPSTVSTALPELRPPFTTVLGYHGSDRTVFLTFDDGPGPQTGQILDVLASNGVKATFCQVGSAIGDHPDTERRIIREGHTLCNHSWSHPDDLAAAPAATIDDEIDRTQRALDAFGVTSHYFRAPGGGFGTTTTLRQVCQLNDVVPLGWSIDSEDWRKPGVTTIVNNVVTAAQPGAIVLMHDAGGADRNQTVAALPGIIKGLRAAGYDLAALPPAGPG